MFRAERAVCIICNSSTAFKMNVYNGISANGEDYTRSERLIFIIHSGAKGFDTYCGYWGVDGTATSVGLTHFFH